MKIELYKLMRKKVIAVLLFINLLSFMYAMALRFKWSFVSVTLDGFSVVNFASSMWAIVFIFGVPLFVLLFLSAGLLAGERTEGQLLLAVTRVADRSKVLDGKFWAVTAMATLFCIVNLMSSVIAFYLFIYGTDYALPVRFDYSLLSEIIQIIGVYVFMLLLCHLVLLCSTKFSMIISVVLVLLLYALCSILNYIPGIQYASPGYWAVNSLELPSETAVLLLQAGINLVLFILVIRRSRSVFKEIDL
nr:ABC transporter permease [Paenibacillus sp. FSL R7-0331]